jgi:hypothetical protein
MISRSIPSKVALGAAAAAVVAAGMISSASGASAAGSSAPAAVGVAAPASFVSDPHLISQGGGVAQFVVAVPSDGWYEVDYQVNYPDSEGLVKTWINNWQLADLVTPIEKSSLGGSVFATNVQTQCVYLYAGQYTITAQGVRLPGSALVKLVEVN